MNLVRQILTALWAAILAGLNAFFALTFYGVWAESDGSYSSMLFWRSVAVPAVLAALCLLALIYIKALWAVIAFAVVNFGFGVLGALQGFQMSVELTIGVLILIVPTYLLLRWDMSARKRDINPAEEF
ncbi:MAG: hypothetical protein AAFQ67_09930 [Pseudomonadota bacterium]